MKTVAMIPARYEASRFPGKLMKDLGGKSVIMRTYENAVSTQLFSDVYVVTDSNLIYEEVVNNGGNAIMSIAEHECGSDRIAEAVTNIECDIVVNVQGDEPFVHKDALSDLLKVFKGDEDKEIDLASIMHSITDLDEINNSNAVKVVIDNNNRALYFSRSPIPYAREKSTAKYYKHQGIYAFRKQALLDFTKLPMKYLEATEKLEQLRYLEFNKNIKMVETPHISIGIDTPEDLVAANKKF
ncbi:3-deoxy-manno-octulosonate cytidylyltransferase [Pseudofulvibacter geojedonensis]|uniref:3-deoxy-manno-octulosonate cytidylyltransferase n=1 Tax=Pseudofulvibacter geojedonensis TaxID=1123758 RepID=A0ABW3HY31_9FLAO